MPGGRSPRHAQNPLSGTGADLGFQWGGGGLKFDKIIFYCEGVEGPAPGEIFDFQRLSHAI